MTSIRQHAYQGHLDNAFFEVPATVYQQLPFRPHEEAAAIRQLFEQEAARNDILVYTADNQLRLVGIFPQGSSTAYFGYWETTNDIALNQAAFAQLRTAAQQRGYTKLQGPLNFNTYHAYRLRLGATPSWGQFDKEPANPEYYPALLEQLGFTPALTFESRLIEPQTMPAFYQDKATLLAALHHLPYDFIALNATTWQQHESELFELVHQVFSANPAYQPIPKAQFELLYNAEYAAKLCPHTSVLLRERSQGRLVALSLCHPNYAALHLGSKPPVFARDYPRLPQKTLLAKTVGVHPDFRNQQLMNCLGAYGMVGFRELYEQVIFCLMRSDNFSLHFTDGLPAEVARYALFELALV